MQVRIEVGFQDVGDGLAGMPLLDLRRHRRAPSGRIAAGFGVVEVIRTLVFEQAGPAVLLGAGEVVRERVELAPALERAAPSGFAVVEVAGGLPGAARDDFV